MKPALSVLSFVIAFGALAACQEPTPPAEAPPAVGAAPADATPPAPDAGDANLPPANGPDEGDMDDADGDNDSGDATATIPTRFRGEWNTDAAACGTGGNESRLLIAADTMRFYESSGPVQSASMDGNELTVTVRLTGEGETRDATYRFRLSADGRTLTDADSALARQRCD